MELKQKLREFQGADNLSSLNAQFLDIAKWFLYGGYISVFNIKGEQYRIYIHAVEFYFHCEKGCIYQKNGKREVIEDPIMYHQNDKFPTKEDEFPYFPLMALHAHDSGYDITFESEEMKYRASALIREYVVYDINKDKRLPGNSGKGGEEYDNRSTYIKRYLNGFSMEDGVCWVKWKDDKEDFFDTITENDITSCKRRGVKKYVLKKDEKGEDKWVKTNEDDEDKKWKFVRTKEYPEKLTT